MMRNQRALAVLAALALGISATPAQADAVGDFFKRLGRSISRPPQPSKPAQPARRSGNKTASKPTAIEATSPTPAATPAATASLTPIPIPVTERRASAAPQGSAAGLDLPYAVPVPARPGFVTSPYAPTSGHVDVRGFASGTAVKDPYTGKIFLAP